MCAPGVFFPGEVVIMTHAGTRKPTPSLHDRRLGVLRRTGLAERHRLPLEKPPPAFFWVLVIVFSLILLGLVMVLSSSSVTNLHTGESAWGMFFRQLVWVGLGGAAMWGAYRMPYDMWRNSALLKFAVLGVVVANVIVILRGELTNGAKAWLDIGPFRMQPSEFMKIMTVIFCANLLANRHRSVAIRNVVLYPMWVVIGVTAGLCGLQRDYGSAVIFAGTVLFMMFQAALPLRHIFVTAVGLGGLGALVLRFARRASERMLAFLDLEATKNDSGYQVYQSLLSIANGGWLGTGIGSGTSKWGYVPLAYSDFIFAVVAEELGIFGTITVIGGFVLLVLLGVQIALASSDMLGALIAGGISAWFGIQAIVNIGGVVGFMPMTGLTLPFISYGGSSLIASMAAIGLLLNVARYVKR
jgi:cell division protein FtsW